MNIPNNLKYTKEHEWLKVEGDAAYVGITNFAQEALGDIVFIELPNLNDRLDRCLIILKSVIKELRNLTYLFKATRDIMLTEAPVSMIHELGSPPVA